MAEFDRYSEFKDNGKMTTVPFIPIRSKGTDKSIIFRKNRMRLDKISYDFYQTPDYAWLIMQANPEYGSIEGFIPDGVKLRIPYPLEETLNQYISDIKSYKELY